MANDIVTARKRSLGQGNVFVRLSFCPRGGGRRWPLSMHRRSHDQGICIRGVCILWGSALGGSAFRGVCIQGYLNPGEVCIQEALGRFPQDKWDTMGYGQQVDGTHFTGMLSCCYNHFSE